MDNAGTIEQIIRIPSPQITSNPLEDDFFNGAKFTNDINNNPESLILPAGCFLPSESFEN